MDKIIFWKDRESKIIDPELFSTKAEMLAKKLADDCQKLKKSPNKRTQIRKFYDEVVNLNTEAKNTATNWENILPLVNMIIAKAAYAKGRDLVSENFLDFIRSSVKQVKASDDLAVFANFFEAFYGFYRLYCQMN